MRKDISKVICERQRFGSNEKSIKTSKSFDLRMDFMDEDYDSGPVFVSSARHRQEARCNPLVQADGGGKKNIQRYKSFNENRRPLFQFLKKSVGRPWNDVYSEIRENLNPNKTTDLDVLDHVSWEVTHDVVMVDGVPFTYYGYGGKKVVSGLYVNPITGLLCNQERKKFTYKKTEEIREIKLDKYFSYEMFKKDSPSVCGCVHFKFHTEEYCDSIRSYRMRRLMRETPVCIHGNPATKVTLWYLAEYKFHNPNDIYGTHLYNPFYKFQSHPKLSEKNPVVVEYYRDHMDKQRYLFSHKTVNKKQMKEIRERLDANK